MGLRRKGGFRSCPCPASVQVEISEDLEKDFLRVQPENWNLLLKSGRQIFITKVSLVRRLVALMNLFFPRAPKRNNTMKLQTCSFSSVARSQNRTILATNTRVCRTGNLVTSLSLVLTVICVSRVCWELGGVITLVLQ